MPSCTHDSISAQIRRSLPRLGPCPTDEEVQTKTMVNTQELSSKNSTLKAPKPVDNPVVTGIWADMDCKIR